MDIEMLRGVSSAGGIKRGPIPLWSATIHFPFESTRKKGRGNRALSKEGRRRQGGRKNRTRSVYDSTPCERGDFPVSRTGLTRLKVPTQLRRLSLSAQWAVCLCLSLWCLKWKVSVTLYNFTVYIPSPYLRNKPQESFLEGFLLFFKRSLFSLWALTYVLVFIYTNAYA